MVKKMGDSAVAARRKDQVLSAAAECVRMEGFHRASMAQISAAAGMSPGHIHHFFGGKESIIEGVVAREHNELADLIQEVIDNSSEAGPIAAFVELVPKCADRYMDFNHAALAVEILAEASRNPKVSKLIQEHDNAMSQSFNDLFGADASDIRSRCEIIAALFEGLSSRALRNAEARTVISRDMLQKIVHLVLTS
ncbi:TetR/AcrR family transcriptional regulator [Pseudomonas palmensis]|uniref:TetR/AcrR family transcriptional regulator n=1 Tax=Pseudomonas palmensis TaxID=2815362 RepID=UPI001AE7538F|nr:TetR/AcrR family transcriptional regulator [Pseudomonas palmensis]